MVKKEFYRVPGLFVYEDGKKILRIRKSQSILRPDSYRYYTIRTDGSGYKYINVNNGRLYVDYLVATCFCFRKPWEKYVIHLDGDKSNCHRNNLKWVPLYDYCQKNIADKHVVTVKGYRTLGEDYYISEHGEVEKHGNTVTVRDYAYDSDTDRHFPMEPYFDYHYTNSYGRGEVKRIPVDKAIARAFLPYPESLSNPELLHKDGDYKNCDLSNLEWVDKNSQEYKNYENKRIDDKANRQSELDEMFHWR